MKKNSKQLSLVELIDICKKAFGHNQPDTLVTIISWFKNDYNGVDLDGKTASKMLKNNDTSFIVQKIGEQFDKSRMKDGLDKLSFNQRNTIINEFKKQGILYGNRQITDSSLDGAFYSQFRHILRPQQKSSKKNKVLQKKTIKKEPGWLSRKDAICNVDSVFTDRFKNNQYQKSFSFLITNKDPLICRSDSFTTSKDKWLQIRDKFLQSTIIMGRHIYIHTDQSQNSPFGPNQNVEFANNINDCDLYRNLNDYTIIKRDNLTVFADKNKAPLLDENGDVIETTNLLCELNPAIPQYAYICEITSYQEKVSSHSNDLITIEFVYRPLANINYEVLVENCDLIGIPLSNFYSKKYRYVEPINIMDRLRKLKNLKPGANTQSLIN